MKENINTNISDEGDRRRRRARPHGEHATSRHRRPRAVAEPPWDHDDMDSGHHVAMMPKESMPTRITSPREQREENHETNRSSQAQGGPCGPPVNSRTKTGQHVRRSQSSNMSGQAESMRTWIHEDPAQPQSL